MKTGLLEKFMDIYQITGERIMAKNYEDVLFEFLMALHGARKMGAELTGFYGVPVENNKYELRLVLKKHA